MRRAWEMTKVGYMVAALLLTLVMLIAAVIRDDDSAPATSTSTTVDETPCEGPGSGANAEWSGDLYEPPDPP